MALQFSRRQFTKSVGAVSAGLVSPSLLMADDNLPQPRKAKGADFTSGGRPLLVSVEGKDIEKMLAKAIDVIGGLGKVVTKGDRVFIKPNYGSHRAYPTGSDPRFLVSIAQQAMKAARCEVTICDSSDAYVLSKYNDFEYVFKVNNVFDIAQKAGVKVICTHPTDEKQYVAVRSGKWEKNPEIKINRHLLGSSVIINQPMLKKHNESYMTCALKIFFWRRISAAA